MDHEPDGGGRPRNEGAPEDPTGLRAGPEGPSPRVQDVIAWRLIWRVILAVVATLALGWILYRMRSLVAMMVIALFFSLALEPAVRWLHERYGWRRGAAVGVIYAAGLVFLIVMVVVLIPGIGDLADQVGQSGPEWAASLNSWTDDTFGFELVDEAAALTGSEGFETAVGEWGDQAFGTIGGIASAGADFVFSVVTIAMFTFYFVADSRRITRTVLSWFPPVTQQRLAWTLDEAIVQTGGYFYSRTLLITIWGVGYFTTMALVGMPVSLALPLAVFGGFVTVFIPVFGIYLGSAVPILITLGVEGPTAALILGGFVLAFNQVENFWLNPKLSAETMNLTGGTAFASALAGGAIAGPVGAFLALPTAALVSSAIGNYAKTYEVTYRTDEDTNESTTPPTE